MKRLLILLVLALPAYGQIINPGIPCSGGNCTVSGNLTVTGTITGGPGAPADNTVAVGGPVVWDATNHRWTAASGATKWGWPVIARYSNTNPGGLHDCGAGATYCIYIPGDDVAITIASGTEGNCVQGPNASGAMVDGGGLCPAMTTGISVGVLTSAVSGNAATMHTLVGYQAASGGTTSIYGNHLGSSDTWTGNGTTPSPFATTDTTITAGKLTTNSRITVVAQGINSNSSGSNQNFQFKITIADTHAHTFTSTAAGTTQVATAATNKIWKYSLDGVCGASTFTGVGVQQIETTSLAAIGAADGTQSASLNCSDALTITVYEVAAIPASTSSTLLTLTVEAHP